MRTTVRLEDSLLRQAKQEAVRRGTTLTRLIEQGLRLVLARSVRSVERPWVRVPVSSARGGTLPGVDLDDSATLLELLEHPG